MSAPQTRKDLPVLRDPLPETWAGAPDEFEAHTATDRPVDEELRPLGYEVYYQPKKDGDRLVSAYYARKAPPRKPAKVFVARLPYGNAEAPSVGDWLVNAALWLQHDPRVLDFRFAAIDDTPTSMVRNKMARVALDWGADVLVFVDSDMKPDYLVGEPGHDNARPFLQTAFDHWWAHPGPCVISAPYCCGGRQEDPLVFRYACPTSPLQLDGVRITRFSREEADTLTGVTRAGALPTGLMLADTRTFRILPTPWFYYEYTDEHCSEKASTEDITFTRDAALHGVPLYCAWDCWAGHWKRKLVGRPELPNALAIPAAFRNACYRNLHRADRANDLSSSV